MNRAAPVSQLTVFAIKSEDAASLSWDEYAHVVLASMYEDRSPYTEVPSSDPDIHRLNFNLGDPVALGAPETQLSAVTGHQILLLSAVIEHLNDPRHLLRMLRRLPKRDPESRLVVGSITNHRQSRGYEEGP